MLNKIAFALLNTPYFWGGKNPLTGFDCSGFVEWVLNCFGMDPPSINNAQNLYDWFIKEHGASSSGTTKGAICFYGRSVGQITHVAIVYNDHQIIEAGGGDSTTTNIEVAKRQGACVRIKPFGHRKDLVAIVMPNYHDWVEL